MPQPTAYVVRPWKHCWELSHGEAGPRTVYKDRREALMRAGVAALRDWRYLRVPTTVVLALPDQAPVVVEAHGPADGRVSVAA